MGTPNSPHYERHTLMAYDRFEQVPAATNPASGRKSPPQRALAALGITEGQSSFGPEGFVRGGLSPVAVLVRDLEPGDLYLSSQPAGRQPGLAFTAHRLAAIEDVGDNQYCLYVKTGTEETVLRRRLLEVLPANDDVQVLDFRDTTYTTVTVDGDFHEVHVDTKQFVAKRLHNGELVQTTAIQEVPIAVVLEWETGVDPEALDAYRHGGPINQSEWDQARVLRDYSHHEARVMGVKATSISDQRILRDLASSAWDPDTRSEAHQGVTPMTLDRKTARIWFVEAEFTSAYHEVISDELTSTMHHDYAVALQEATALRTSLQQSLTTADPADDGTWEVSINAYKRAAGGDLVQDIHTTAKQPNQAFVPRSIQQRTTTTKGDRQPLPSEPTGLHPGSAVDVVAVGDLDIGDVIIRKTQAYEIIEVNNNLVEGRPVCELVMREAGADFDLVEVYEPHQPTRRIRASQQALTANPSLTTGQPTSGSSLEGTDSGRPRRAATGQQPANLAP